MKKYLLLLALLMVNLNCYADYLTPTREYQRDMQNTCSSDNGYACDAN